VIPEIVATFASGIFAGAAAYINFVEHPARLSCGVLLAVTEWRPSYKRGTLMQASLAVIGSLSAFMSWWFERSLPWLLGGVLLLLIIPFTLIVILPTNKRLESQELDFAALGPTSRSSQHPERSGLSHISLYAYQSGLNQN